MSPDTALRRRLAEHAGQGRWGLFTGLGAAGTVIGGGLFAFSASGEHAERAWQLFHPPARA